MEINHQSIPVGSVAYYIHHSNNHYNIGYGIVEEHYPSCICLRLLESKDTRTINGVPYKDFKTPTEWKKLPKGWTYNTKLFDCGNTKDGDEVYAVLSKVKINDSEEILKAYQNGYLVDADSIDRSKIEAIIDKGQWRLERKYGDCTTINEWNRPTHVSVDWHQVYVTYEEAKAVLDAQEAETQRIINLSDYDWSVEQIDEVLNRWVKMCGGSDAIKAKYREWLLKQDKVEDIEVRTYMGEVQWKYAKNKRWMSIEI